MILTLQISDTLAEQLQEEADAEGSDLNRYAAMRLEQAVTPDEVEFDPELIATLQKAIDDTDAGHLLTMEQVESNVHAALAARRRKITA